MTIINLALKKFNKYYYHLYKLDTSFQIIHKIIIVGLDQEKVIYNITRNKKSGPFICYYSNQGVFVDYGTSYDANLNFRYATKTRIKQWYKIYDY
jgi:hypothetical protein